MIVMKVLIVEDDADLAAAMGDYLALQGVECDFSYHGEACLNLVEKNTFDVIILDLMLPKMGGFEVCKQLRKQENLTPVLMLTACDAHSEQLMGFKVGIDDYVVKPCPMPLLWARLQALYRRDNPQTAKRSVDTLTFYFKEFRATREGHELKLSPTVRKILELLIRRSPDVVSRAELEDYAWPDMDVDTGNFNVQVHQLRKAVDKPFSYPLIHTVIGAGLCLKRKDSIENGE